MAALVTSYARLRRPPPDCATIVPVPLPTGERLVRLHRFLGLPDPPETAMAHDPKPAPQPAQPPVAPSQPKRGLVKPPLMPIGGGR